mmetsp:Transcript_34432/g.72108  ORF Transcript_34432/g.72108 Transcript_34432/m.72108 type:complete len:394 (-) Transcript_34432:115-1296(-)
MASSALVLLAISSVLSGVVAKQLMFRRDVAGISPVTSALSLVHNMSDALDERSDQCAVAGVPRRGSQCEQMNYHDSPASQLTPHMVKDYKTFQPCRNTIHVPGSARPMPAVGYIGCCRIMLGPQVYNGAKDYLKHGGRLLDTAQMYMNEHLIGSVVKDSGIPREEIWVTTKINVFLAPKIGTREWAVRSVDQSLRSLGLDYIDVMYLHFGPAASTFEMFPITVDQDVELWKGLIDARNAGKILNIGVCMHTQSEIENLKLATGEAPAVAMFWHNPFMPSVTNDYVSWLRGEGIAVSMYGALNFMYGIGWGPSNTQKHAVNDVANMTWAQVVIRWALDQNMAIITDMHESEHIREDLDCSSGNLTSSDLERLEKATPKWTCASGWPSQLLMGCD